MLTKYEVHLDSELRKDLEGLLRKESVGAAKVRKARILLLADSDHADGQRTDLYIAEHVGVSEKTVYRTRRKFVEQGIDSSLVRKKRCTPATPWKFDGRAEAQLVALCCSEPPDGHQRWTLKLLVEQLQHLKIVQSVCPETVRRCLKKIALNHGTQGDFVFPKETVPDSLLTWKKSSMSTTKRTTNKPR